MKKGHTAGVSFLRASGTAASEPQLIAASLIVTPGLLAIAATGHVAPAATTVAAVVKEEPFAIWRFTKPHKLQFLRRQQIGGRLRYLP